MMTSFRLVLLGDFNKQGIKDVLNKVTNEIENLDGKQFAILINYINFFGATHEVFKIIAEYNYWLVTKNIVAKARVIINKTISAAIDSQINLIGKPKHRDFESESNAIFWLEMNLYNEIRYMNTNKVLRNVN